MRSSQLLVTTLALIAVAPVFGQAPPQPRLPPVPESEWPEELRVIAADVADLGMPNLVATYANHPIAAAALLPHLQYIWTGSALPARHRTLLGMRALWLARSDYLWTHRSSLALLAEGLTPADLARIARGPDAPGWDEFEATLLRAADELYVDSFISDATWNALSERYDLPALIDVIDTVGALTLNAGLVNSLGVRLEPGVVVRQIDVPYAVAAERTNVRLVGKAPRIAPEIPEGASFAANVFYTFRHNPPADRVRGAINTHVTGRSSTLDPLYREFLLVRIGTLCRSEYEYAAHVRVGRGAGMTDDDLTMILAAPGERQGAPEKLALLEATDELYADTTISNATWAKLAAFLSPEQRIDLLVAVGGYRSTSMLINSAGVQLDANMANFRFPPELR